MTKQITLEELLELVTVEQNSDGEWHIIDVKGDVYANVYGDVGGFVDGYVGYDIRGNVHGYICGSVGGNVKGDVKGNVYGTINGREWQYIETPKDKLKRLIEETGNEELLEAFNQLEDN